MPIVIILLVGFAIGLIRALTLAGRHNRERAAIAAAREADIYNSAVNDFYAWLPSHDAQLIAEFNAWLPDHDAQLVDSLRLQR